MLAQSVRKSDFFDFAYAQWLWGTLTTGEAYDAEWAKVKPVYIAWEKRYKQNKAAALEELANHPDANLIKKGHDIGLTYKQWKKGYKTYRRGDPTWGMKGAAYPWNNKGRAFYCMSMRTINIFTNSCTDWPDWRLDKSRLEDEANVAKNWPIVQKDMAAKAAAGARTSKKKSDN